MPFPKMDNKATKVGKYGYSIQNVSKEEAESYITELEQIGYESYSLNKNGDNYTEADYVLYNDKIRVIFYLRNDCSMDLYVYTGFVKSPVVSSEKVRSLIDENNLIKDNDKFSEYYIIPIENETVRKENFFEYIIGTPRIVENWLDIDMLPYYLITDGERIYLFEQGLFMPEMLWTSNIVQQNGKKQLVVVACKIACGNDIYDKTEIYTYKLNDNQFMLENEKKILRKVLRTYFI